MFQEEFMLLAGAAEKKSGFLRINPFGYLISAMLAGMFVGFGIMLIYTSGGLLGGAAYTKILMGASFAVALSLVIMAGAELFTGNNMIMMAGVVKGRTKWSDLFKIWLVSYIGNWIGSVLFALLFWGTGLASGTTGEFIAATAEIKMSIAALPLFLRGVFCNTLVCLAVWCSFKLKSESAKLIMIFWCMFAFITTGYEHSVANMSLLTVSLLEPFDYGISLGGYFYNILVVTFGNIVGGVCFVAVPYYFISRRD